MLLSVIIPVYNNEAYIGACVDSILSQGTDDLEIILIDDGSTDGSGAACDAMAAAHPAVIRVEHIPNGGVSNARNLGIAKSTGEYLWFVDSDDEIMPGSLSVLRACIRKNHSDFISFGVRQICFRDGAILSSEELLPKQGERIKASEAFPYLQDHQLLDLVADKLCRRSLITENGIAFDQADLPTEDHIFWLKIYPHLNSVDIVEQALYVYNQRSGVSHSIRHRYRKFPAYCKALKMVTELARSFGCGEALADYRKRTYWLDYAWEFETLNHRSCHFGIFRRANYFREVFSVDTFDERFRKEAVAYRYTAMQGDETAAEKTAVKLLIQRKYLPAAVISFLTNIRGRLS